MSNHTTNRYHRTILGAIVGLLTTEHSTLFVSLVGNEPLPASVPSDTKTWAELKIETETSFQQGVETVRLPQFQRMQDFVSKFLTNEAPNSLARYRICKQPKTQI
jgi:hypothetical protein